MSPTRLHSRTDLPSPTDQTPEISLPVMLSTGRCHTVTALSTGVGKTAG